MRVFAIFLVVIAHSATSQKKCCDHDSYLKKNYSNYICDKTEDKRLQIFTEQIDYLKQLDATGEDSCLDVNQNITEFKFKNFTVVEENQIDVNFYPKCCPLNYFYNSVKRSCVWKQDLDQSFIKQKFVKVGLPHCKVIVDYKDYQRIELDTLHVGSATFPEGKYCIDKDENDLLIARGCHDDLDVCSKIKCIHKCCPDGQSFINGSFCRNTYTHGLDLQSIDGVDNATDPFAIIHGYNCKIYVLKKYRTPFYVDSRGIFWAFYNKTLSYKSFEIDEKSYCIEHARKKDPVKNYDNFEFFMCFPEEKIREKILYSRWAKIVSCVCISITMAVYLLLPEMLNLFGKILFSYCASNLVAFLTLIYTQFDREIGDKICVNLAFSSFYASLCSFTWLNVMCFDIWWTFGTQKSLLTAQQRKSDLRRFVLYSIYGWGIPTVITLLTYAAYVSEGTPFAVKPFLASYKCFLETRPENYGKFLYYATPLIFMEIGNVFMFIKTIRYCLKVRREINKMNDSKYSSATRRKSFKSDKEQLLLILKLSVIMGISFVFETVSSLISFDLNPVTKYIEVIWDTFNGLQGLFIFLIFICKVRIYRLIWAKIRGVKARKISLSSLQTTTTVSTPLTSGFKARNV